MVRNLRRNQTTGRVTSKSDWASSNLTKEGCGNKPKGQWANGRRLPYSTQKCELATDPGPTGRKSQRQSCGAAGNIDPMFHLRKFGRKRSPTRHRPVEMENAWGARIDRPPFNNVWRSKRGIRRWVSKHVSDSGDTDDCFPTDVEMEISDASIDSETYSGNPL